VNRYLIAVDDSKPARAAQAYTMESLDPSTDRISVISVTETTPGSLLKEGESLLDDPESIRDEMNRKTDELVETVVGKFRESGFEADGVTMAGDPGSQICNFAVHIDSDGIILGRQGRGKIQELLLGSVSQYVLHHAECPVTIVPTDFKVTQ
jgi:nucleotide-binding universal stress UspA family protein